MLSLVNYGMKYVVQKIFGGHDTVSDQILAPDKLEDLLAIIDDKRQITEEIEEPQLNKIEDEEGCFTKTGIVTLVKSDYVLIDYDYLCEMKYVIPQDLKNGDKVVYMAYRKNVNDQLKVRKIDFKIETTWEEDDRSYEKSDENGRIDSCETGTVTIIEKDFVLIDNEYVCETRYVMPTDLAKGDRVRYTAYNDENDKTKIRKIILKLTPLKSDSNNEDDDKLFCATGTVTDVKRDYVLLDNEHTFYTSSVIPTDLIEGDEVNYTAIKDENKQLRIQKIVYKIQPKHSTKQEAEPAGEVVPQTTYSPSEAQSHQIIDKKGISKRVVNSKVIARQGREIILEDQTRVSLDSINSEFVPYVGDWVKLECLVEVNYNVPNLQGEILEFEKIEPLRSNHKIGQVTDYNDELGHGEIEKTIVFSKNVCASGYIPCKRDKVIVHYIESEQGVGKHWRALHVVPLEDLTTKFETSVVKMKPQMPPDEVEELIRDKENIEITNNIKVSLDVKSDVDIEITLKNNGNFRQTLYKCSFFSRKFDSQLTLVSPIGNEPHVLKPADSIIYTLKCKARCVGVSDELIIFKFKNFKIGRIITIIVKSINTTKPIPDGSFNTYANNQHHRGSVIPRVLEEGMYIRGVKPYTTPRFIRERPTTWKIPDILWTTINQIVQERKTHSEAEFLLSDKFPILQQRLTVENYKQRFDYLLYLEEIAQILDMKRFDMAEAVMHRSAEFLTLHVPGLAEKRPSLIVGDKVIVTFEWKNDGKHYEGFIHKIKASDVFLKFNSTFHDEYHGEVCQISFKGSTTVLQRCHTAIGLAMKRLGPEFLFPTKIVQKDAQYDLIEVEGNSHNPHLDGYTNMQKIDQIRLDRSLDNDERVKAVQAILNSKRFEWFNKSLNVYQKEAVKNILRGVARPLPYVIFGPPGTGKTITVCESILQILFTMNDSRILVATPSNSSANLIAERLLESNKLQPGDMVRLVAHHYLESEQIPDKLIPYCATADIAEEGTRPDVNIRDQRGYQKNVTLSVLCRHRIIVGTCSAIGILHNMGCKPGHFTHVVVDEAGQATEPQIMIPLVLAHMSSSQVILAGDPQQLGPINQSRLAGYFGLNDSFLVRLLQKHFPYERDTEGFESGYDPRLITKLLMNYRSLPELLDLPNKLFYEAELKAMVDEVESDEAKLLDHLSDMLPERLGAPLPVVFHAVPQGKNMQDQDSPSWYNTEEATQVFIYLLDLYNKGLKREDIGIITPYSKQVYKIRNLLAEMELEVPKVGSVEEFQGQERKVIILSTVRTAENKIRDDIRHSLGFVASKERLNVAITRARTLLIIIGNPNLLQQDYYWRSVLDYCKSRNAYVGNTFVK